MLAMTVSNTVKLDWSNHFTSPHMASLNAPFDFFHSGDRPTNLAILLQLPSMLGSQICCSSSQPQLILIQQLIQLATGMTNIHSITALLHVKQHTATKHRMATDKLRRNYSKWSFITRILWLLMKGSCSSGKQNCSSSRVIFSRSD